jgi:hypothetical protein
MRSGSLRGNDAPAADSHKAAAIAAGRFAEEIILVEVEHAKLCGTRRTKEL